MKYPLAVLEEDLRLITQQAIDIQGHFVAGEELTQRHKTTYLISLQDLVSNANRVIDKLKKLEF